MKLLAVVSTFTVVFFVVLFIGMVLTVERKS